MPIRISGSTGVSGLDGTATDPSTQGANTSSGLFFPTINTVAIATNSSERLRIDGNGSVGIGTSSPGYKLDVTGTVNAASLLAGILTVSGNVSLTGANNWFLPMTSVIDNGVAGISWYQTSPLSYGIYRSSGAWSAPNYQQLNINFDTGIIINGGNAFGKSGTIIQPSGGNVGIGTTSPGYKLDVTGTVNAASLLVNGSAAVTSATSPWVLVGSVTATNGAAIQNTTFLTSSYGRYMFVIRDVFTITNATTIFMQFYSGGAYQTANYYAAGTVLQTAGYTNMPLTTALYLSYPSQSSSVHPYYGIIHMLNPASTTYYKPYFGHGTVFNGTSQMNTYQYGGGWQGGTGAITGFQVYAGSGNITGTVQVYGAV